MSIQPLHQTGHATDACARYAVSSRVSRLVSASFGGADEIWLFASLPMMPRCGFLLSLAIAIWPLPANAQPLFHYERNWTITTGEHLYGLRQVAETPGDRRFTQVWLGRCTFDMRCRAEEVVVHVLLLPRAYFDPRVWVVVDWNSFRRVP
jgi:hypothetical protein